MEAGGLKKGKKKHTKMASSSSSSNPHATVEVREEEYSHTYTYPYPSNLSAASFISVKLSGKDEYGMWKTQMVCLLKSHDMFGFIDGTVVSPDEPNSSSVSGKEKVGSHQTHQKLWTRSDALAKGWILGSLSKETLGYIVNPLTGGKLHQGTNAADDFSAKDVWDELQTMYDPVVLPQLPHDVTDTLQDEDRERDLQRLYLRTQVGDWDWVAYELSFGRATVIDKITNNGNTALHVAVGTSKKPEFFGKLLERIPENIQLMDVKNSDGSTLLHVAAIIGNTEAADILVAREPDLLLAEDKEGQTPLALALSNMHTETARHLLKHINSDTQKDALFSGTTGDGLLVTVISSKDFCFAIDLLKHYKTLNSDAVLMAIAQNLPLNVFEIYIGIFGFYRSLGRKITERCPPWVAKFIINPFLFVTYVILMLFLFIHTLLVSPFIKDRIQRHEDAMRLLQCVSRLIKNKNHSSSYHHYYTNPIFEATRQNAYGFVEEIVFLFPNAIWSANEDGHNIIQYAVINRSEKVYNLLYQMIIPNALIITVVFAAAITVPGGSNQDTGIPIFTNNTAFTVFAISDAISLFAAVTSLLMFLSILTARFAEEDFLIKLPTKLVIGLATLFISTTAMIVAFGATLYLVFGQRNSKILIPIAVLTFLPITSFVTLQFPLVLGFMFATYGRSIFREKRSFFIRVD